MAYTPDISLRIAGRGRERRVDGGAECLSEGQEFPPRACPPNCHFHVQSAAQIMSTFSPQGITAVSRRASIRLIRPFLGVQVEPKLKHLDRTEPTELTLYTFDSR
jgi:hypothetical protein